MPYNAIQCTQQKLRARVFVQAIALEENFEEEVRLLSRLSLEWLVAKRHQVNLVNRSTLSSSLRIGDWMEALGSLVRFPPSKLGVLAWLGNQPVRAPDCAKTEANVERAHRHEQYLIYEFLAGGDLHHHLELSKTGAPFAASTRVSAAFQAACGLSYMVNSTPKAFHRDIKPANILLDRCDPWCFELALQLASSASGVRNGTAKMVDFGLSGTVKAGHSGGESRGEIGSGPPGASNGGPYQRHAGVTRGDRESQFWP